MNGRPGVWAVFAILIALGSYMQFSIGAAAGGELRADRTAELLNTVQTDDPWWAEDDPFGSGNDPYGTDDPYGSDDGPWWAEDDNSYESDAPWWAEDNNTCYGNQCDSERVWWEDSVGCFGSLCDDDPWNGSTAGCTYGICDDDSYLVDCSYVTVAGFGAEGACDGPLSKIEFDNCHPVTGSGATFGQNRQTFRCTDAAGYQSGGYSLTDIAPNSNEDVVQILCSEGAMGLLDRSSCEGAPAGVKYHTCEQDHRMSSPTAIDQEWFICQR